MTPVVMTAPAPVSVTRYPGLLNNAAARGFVPGLSGLAGRARRRGAQRLPRLTGSAPESRVAPVQARTDDWVNEARLAAEDNLDLL